MAHGLMSVAVMPTPTLKTSVPCAIRRLKSCVAHHSASMWWGKKSPVWPAWATMSASVIVRPSPAQDPGRSRRACRLHIASPAWSSDSSSGRVSERCAMGCSRAGAGLAPSAVPSLTRSVDFSLPKPEEAMAVPVGPRHRLCDLGQAAESLAIPGEAANKSLALPRVGVDEVEDVADRNLPFATVHAGPYERVLQAEIASGGKARLAAHLRRSRSRSATSAIRRLRPSVRERSASPL